MLYDIRFRAWDVIWTGECGQIIAKRRTVSWTEKVTFPKGRMVDQQEPKFMKVSDNQIPAEDKSGAEKPDEQPSLRMP